MLEHQKSILANLSSIRSRFRQELTKSIDWLEPEEMNELHRWVMENFWKTHEDVISEVFVFT